MKCMYLFEEIFATIFFIQNYSACVVQCILCIRSRFNTRAVCEFIASSILILQGLHKPKYKMRLHIFHIFSLLYFCFCFLLK